MEMIWLTCGPGKTIMADLRIRHERAQGRPVFDVHEKNLD
jgi:hypothetical protein